MGPVICHQKWICNDCNADLDPIKVKHVEDQISKAQEKLGKIQARFDLAQARQMFKDFQTLLYPSNGFMLEILQALITCTAAAVNNPGPEKESQMQRERISWCSQILEALDVLEPGLSIGRGRLSLIRASADPKNWSRFLEYWDRQPGPRSNLKFTFEGNLANIYVFYLFSVKVLSFLSELEQISTNYLV